MYYGYRYSQQFGGAIITTHNNVDIRQSIFENNGAQYLDYSGAIFAEQQSVITINSSSFINNSALNGIVYLNSSSITELNCLDNRGGLIFE